MATVWFEGIDDLNTIAAQLESKAGRVGQQGAAVVRAAANRVEALGKQFAPVDTGHLKNSIGVDVTGDGRFSTMEAEIGPTASYGGHVEWGTERMAPRSYMGAALDRVAPDFMAAMEKVSDPTGDS